MTGRPGALGATVTFVLTWVLLISTVAPNPGPTALASDTGTPGANRGREIVATAAETATLATGVTFTLDGTSPVPIRSASVGYHPRWQETVYSLSTPLPPEMPDGRFSLSLSIDPRQDGLPPGLTLASAWHLVFIDGTTWTSPARDVEWVDDRFDWSIRRAGNVEVMVGADDASDRGDRIVAEVARALPVIERLIATTVPDPIRFWVYDSSADLAGTRTANVEPWIAASSFPELGVTLAAIPPGDTIEIGRLVPHELSHHVLYHAAVSPFSAPPLWFDEGLAGWFQSSGAEGFSALVTAAAAGGTLPSVAALASSFPFESSEASLAYAACWSVMTFVIETRGEAAIPRLASAFAADLTDDAASLAALGVDQRALDREWRAWLGPDRPG